MNWWKKCRELAKGVLPKNAGKDGEEKERKRRSRQPKVRWTLVENLEHGYFHYIDDRAELGGCKCSTG